MKNSIRTLLKLLPLVLSGFALVDCGGSSGGSSTPVAAYVMQSNGTCLQTSNNTQVPVNYCTTGVGTNGYVMQANGTCLQTATNTVVATTLCTTGIGTNGYVMQANGTCIQSATGQPAPTTYCTSGVGVGTIGYGIGTGVGVGVGVGIGVGIGGGYSAQPCIGYYTSPSTGTTGYCNGYNCSGYTLISPYGQAVLCR